MNEEQLRAALARKHRNAGWRCPDEAALAEYADGRIEASVRQRLEEHLAGCEPCLRQVAALTKLAEAPLPVVSSALVSRAARLSEQRAEAPRMVGWRWIAAAAAMACLAVAIAPRMRHPSVGPVAVPSETPAVRQLPTPALRPQLEFPRDGDTVGQHDPEFRWSGLEGALFYELLLVTAEGDEVWKGRADGVSLRIPASAGLVPGRKYYVWVSAWLPQGKAVKSAVAAFIYRP